MFRNNNEGRERERERERECLPVRVADHLPHLYQETVHTKAGVFFLHVTENKSILSIRELSTVS